jgi:hypothetical protein
LVFGDCISTVIAQKTWLYTLFGGICHIVGLISERNKKSKRTELKSDTLAKIKIL